MASGGSAAAEALLRDPRASGAEGREAALAALAVALTERPWAPMRAERAAVRDAGVSEEGAVQAVTIAAVFNHLTRVADGTGVEPDYASPLPRIVVDRAAPPAARPDRASWTASRGIFDAVLALRPKTREAMARWAAYARTPSAGLPARERAVVGAAVAAALCDAWGEEAWERAIPASERERALAAYAETLTVTPWRVDAESLAPLRAVGFDDRGLLDVIALVGFQNMETRVRVSLGAGY